MPFESKSPADERLSAVLRSWKVEADPSPRFADQVWHRIERRNAGTPWSRFLAVLASLTDRPRLAAGFALMLLVAGAGAGLLRGRADAATLTSELQARYVQSIDPFAEIAP